MSEQATQVTPDAIMQLGLGFWGSKTLLSAVELGPVHRAGRRGRARRRGAARPPRPAPAERARLLRRAGRAGHARARGRPLRQHARDRPVPRPGQALLRRRHAGDGERPPLPVLGLADRGAADRRAAERGQGRRGLLRRALRRPGAAGAVRARDERHQRRARRRRSPAKFPWSDHQTVIDIGCAEGAVPVQIALAHEHLTGGGFDLPAVEPIFDGYVGRLRAERPADASPPATSSPTRCRRRTCW